MRSLFLFLIDGNSFILFVLFSLDSLNTYATILFDHSLHVLFHKDYRPNLFNELFRGDFLFFVDISKMIDVTKFVVQEVLLFTNLRQLRISADLHFDDVSDIYVEVKLE